jgi:hypothetical protein
LETIPHARETLEEIARHRCLTSSQVSQLFYRPPIDNGGAPDAWYRSAANADRYANRSTLRPLKDLQLVEAIRPWLSGEDGGLCRRETNVLTPAGAEALQAWYDADGRGRRVQWSAAVRDLDGTNQAHAEAIVDVYVRFKRAAAPPLLFWGWKDDRTLTRLAGEGKTHLRSGIPDAVFVLTAQVGGQNDHHPVVVEVDRGTETVWAADGRGRDWRAKIERYEAYFAGPYRGDPLFHGFSREPLVLCLTVSERRMDHLIDATTRVAASPRYRFATHAAFLDRAATTVLDVPMWRTAGTGSASTLRDVLAQ